MRELLDFQKDELVLPDESDENKDEGSDSSVDCDFQQKTFSVEEAQQIVSQLDKGINNITNVIRGMDKKMSYNLRLVGGLIQEMENSE